MGRGGEEEKNRGQFLNVSDKNGHAWSVQKFVIKTNDMQCRMQLSKKYLNNQES